MPLSRAYGPGSAGGGTFAPTGAVVLAASDASTDPARGNAVTAILPPHGSTDVRLRREAAPRGIRPPEKDDKPRNGIDQLTVSTPADVGAFTRLLDIDEATMMGNLRTWLRKGMRSSTNPTTGGGETGSGELNSERKHLPRYAEGMPRTSTLFAADLAMRAGQTMEPLGLGLPAQYAGCDIVLLRTIPEEFKDEHVEVALEGMVRREGLAQRELLKMVRVEAGAAR